MRSTDSSGSKDDRKVWLDYDQAALNDAYDQSVYAPNFKQVIRRMERASDHMRSRIGEPQVFSYGPSDIEKIYYYPAKAADAPIHVHVHGGAWKQRRVEGVMFPAEMFVASSIGFASFDFISVDETNGELGPMLEQVCRGLAWIANHVTELGGRPDRLYLSGFSSGAHLAAVAMTTDWKLLGFHHIPYNGALLASGMYDLHPVRLSKRSEYVNFTDEIEEIMSPIRHLDSLRVPIILVHGDLESPEFQRQTRDFAQELIRSNKSVCYFEAEGFNHYEIMESFGNPFSTVGQALLHQAHGS